MSARELLHGAQGIAVYVRQTAEAEGAVALAFFESQNMRTALKYWRSAWSLGMRYQALMEGSTTKARARFYLR